MATYRPVGVDEDWNLPPEARTALAGSTELSAAFDAMPQSYADPRQMPDGAVSSLTVGDLAASFGNSPAVVAGDRITHTPTTGSNSAAYIESQLQGPVRRIGMEVEWPAGSDGTFAIVIPNESWASGIESAGLHTTVTAAGVIASGRNVSGTNQGTQVTRVEPLTGLHTIEAVLDDVRQEITVIFDGIEVLRYVDATAFTLLSQFAIWELFQANGTSGTPGFIRSMWAGVRNALPSAPRGSRIERVRKGYGNVFATAVSITVATTYRSVLAIGSLGVYFPPSGRLLCEYEVWISSNALTANVRRLYGSIASSQDRALMYGGQVGIARCKVIVTGTPGALQILSPQMWAEDTSGVVVATVSSTSGPAIITATPLEAVVPTS